jgi:phosphoenolpyruvate carboxykinase (GTP)
MFQARNWQHGVFVGATMASETTAAATGAVGILRRDPMAMLPFCGYNMADYFKHWLAIGRTLSHPPPIFHVNWFRRDSSGNFLWPGFGENLRALLWIVKRVQGQATGEVTPIGVVPKRNELNLDGLDLPQASFDELLRVDRSDWSDELNDQRQFLSQFGERLPHDLNAEIGDLSRRLGRTVG